jgi:hypothetical protein
VRTCVHLPPQGQDLSGVAALGGVQYFNVAVETPEGDMALLEKVEPCLRAAHCQCHCHCSAYNGVNS